jgi:magnesium-dependent phosphatase 1
MKKLFVFDLDFTLWDAGGTWCDCTIPPYRIKQDEVLDSEGAHIKLYPDVIKILNRLREQGKIIAVASRTNAPKNAKQLLNLLKIDQLIDFKEIYPKEKTNHLKEIALRSGVDYKQMVFFDDEMRNINDVATLGVECIHIPEGINESIVQRYI